MSKGNRKSLWIASLSLLLIVSACGGGKTPPATSTPAVEETAVAPSPSPEPTPMPYHAPLTGVGLEAEASAKPVAVMINNFSAARPQSGLTNADVVWEVLAEGGITRLIAIFQSTDALTDTIGPVRSNRAYLIDIADSYGAVMAHAGGSPEAYSILRHQNKQYLDEITNAGSYFWRSKDRKAPHNLYTNLEKLREGADKRGYLQPGEPPSYLFAENGAISGSVEQTAETATDIEIKFLMDSYKVGYRYDETSGLYMRSINGEPHIDMNNDEQLSASNLIVFETKHRTLDNEGRLAVDLESGGAAYLFQKGKKTDAEWILSADGMIRFTKDGAELTLLPGKTYIHIVPNSPALPEHVTWVQNENNG